MSDSLWPHGLQYTRPPCPPPPPGVYSNSSPLSRWCHPTVSSCGPLLLLPSIFRSIRVLSSEHHMAEVLELHPKEYSGLISFRMDWFDLLGVQGTLKSLLQHHSSKTLMLGSSAFSYGPTLTSIHDCWKNIALTRRTFVSEVTSLCFENYFLNPNETSKVTGNTGIVLKGKYMAC